ncbi:MAG: rhamnogalacturonan acetylesterase [Clostridia bacterium]|nr:rhamnogalacturonan acetylesterase [Clostridia bacterium]
MNQIFIIGDSTVTDNTPPFRGWGWALPDFVRDGVRVFNHAESGCSTRSFLAEGRFEPVEKDLSAGDLLFIQFGHNDEKDDERHTDPETTYRENLRRYCRAALEKGAQPVLLTPVSRRFFIGEGPSMLYTHGEYPRNVRIVAEEDGIPLCDLKADSRALYLSLGEEKTAELFVRLKPGENPDFPDGHDDKTHFNPFGARKICALVVREMSVFPACAAYLREDALARAEAVLKEEA